MGSVLCVLGGFFPKACDHSDITHVVCMCLSPQGSPVSAQVYERYPVGLGAALYREHFDFNAEPPWDPSW